MTLRFKFTIFFSLLLSFILVLSVIAIYFLNSDIRESDFRKRLLAQAYYSYRDYFTVVLTPDQLLQTEDRLPNTIRGAKIVIANINYQLLVNADSLTYKPTQAFFKTLSPKQPYYFSHHNIESCAVLIDDGHPAYVVISGFDKFGFERQQKLFWVLFMVTLAGIFVITVLAFFLVKLVTRPLIELGAQIANISESSLKQRITVKTGRVNYEQEQIASQFNAMLERLEAAFESQKSFVHHASHELRTPLASMLLQTESALRKSLTIDEAKAVLESLKEDQQEMIELTNSLLLLSQYERVTMSSDWPALRLDEVLYETLGMVKRMLPGVNVSFEFAQIPDDDLFLSIRGNDSLIRSAFRNLIKNAWLYSDDKSVAITIDATNTQIYLHFNNNGKLLSADEQERLFIPFFRASNSMQKKGFGLGLNIIQRIVALHKGTIAYSIHENLNRFTLSFPKITAGD